MAAVDALSSEPSMPPAGEAGGVGVAEQREAMIGAAHLTRGGAVAVESDRDGAVDGSAPPA